MKAEIEVLAGAALDAGIEDVARLRIEVFRDFPYLYDGDMAYEVDYLSRYRDAPGATIVTARFDDRIVGAATGLPLAEADPVFIDPVSSVGLDPSETFYCAESVLLPGFRGDQRDCSE